MQVSSRGYNAYIGWQSWQRSLRLAASIGNFPQRSHSQGRDKQTVHGHGAQTLQDIYTLPVPPDPAAARFSKINRKIICADTRQSMIVVHCKQLASSWKTIGGRFQFPCHTAPFLIADGWGRVSPWFFWRLCRSNYEKPNSWARRAGPAWVAFNVIALEQKNWSLKIVWNKRVRLAPYLSPRNSFTCGQAIRGTSLFANLLYY